MITSILRWVFIALGAVMLLTVFGYKGVWDNISIVVGITLISYGVSMGVVDIAERYRQ